MSDDVGLRSATWLASALRAGELGSVELLDHYLARTEHLNPALNAVVTLDGERARVQAAAADEARARGHTFGPLHGVPVTIKDALATAGLRTTGGAAELAEHVPDADAPAVARLRAAGAIVFGKTNLPKWSGDWQSYNSLFGTANNPWDLSRTPGGSSGGAAAAVAAGLTSFEVGTDIGGSIRVPAHCTGVYGHKPSFGLVSQLGYLDRVDGGTVDVDMNVVGPLARSADDLAFLLHLLAGPDTDRATAWSVTLPGPRRDALAGYRMAAWFDDPAGRVDDEILEVLHLAVVALRRAGASIDEAARPAYSLAAADDLYRALVGAALSPTRNPDSFEMAAVAEAEPPEGQESELVQMSRNVAMRHRRWLELQIDRARLRRVWADFFRTYDVMLCPVFPVVAFPHDHSDDMFSRTTIVNGVPQPYLDNLIWPGVIGVAYLPATVAPIGFTRAGLPVGIQIVGPYLEDNTPIDVARRLASATGGYVAPPMALGF